MFDKGMNDAVGTGWQLSASLKRASVVMALLVLTGFSVPALAQVELKTTVSKVVIETGADDKPVRRLVDASNVVPGDTLQYVISFTNKGADVVDAGSIVITNPLPPDTVYVDGTAQGSGTDISFSVDSGATFGQPAELKVIKDGVETTAQAADYTTIRWAFKRALEAGKTGDVTFNVRLK